MSTYEEQQKQLHEAYEARQQEIKEAADRIYAERGDDLKKQAEIRDEGVIPDPALQEAAAKETAQLLAEEGVTNGNFNLSDHRDVPDEAFKRAQAARDAIEQGQDPALQQEQQLGNATPITERAGSPEQAAPPDPPESPLPRDRNHTDINRYAVLDALSDAQRSQENQSSVTAEWQPAAIEVLGSAASPRGPDDGQSPNGPTEPPHSPAPQPEVTNGPDHQDTLRAMAEHQPAVDPSPMPQQSAEHQDTFQAMMNGQPGAEPTSVQHGADHQDTLQVMKDEHPAADHSREQHDNDLMKDFVTQETKDQLAAQERQQDFQRQRENEKSMSM